MATVVGEYAAFLCRLLEAVQANEDPSSFQNSCMGLREAWQSCSARRISLESDCFSGM